MTNLIPMWTLLSVIIYSLTAGVLIRKTRINYYFLQSLDFFF